jgi:hypothetical protein
MTLKVTWEQVCALNNNIESWMAQEVVGSDDEILCQYKLLKDFKHIHRSVRNIILFRRTNDWDWQEINISPETKMANVIWILRHNGYDEYRIEGIFATRKALETYVEAKVYAANQYDWELWDLEKDNTKPIKQGSVKMKLTFDTLLGADD